METATAYNFEDFVKYVFQELSKEDENRMEQFLDNHPEYEAMVRGIMDFCMERSIKTRSRFEEQVKELNLTGFFDSVLNKHVPEKIRQKRRPFFWIALIGVSAFLIVLAWIWSNFIKNPTTTPVESTHIQPEEQTIPPVPPVIEDSTESESVQEVVEPIPEQLPTEAVEETSGKDNTLNRPIAWLQDETQRNGILEAVVERHPLSGNLSSQDNWENAVKTGQYTLVRKKLTDFFADHPAYRYPRRSYFLGLIYLYGQEQDFDQAVRYLESAHATITRMALKYPGHIDSGLHLALALVGRNEAGDAERAADLYLQFLEIITSGFTLYP